MFRTINTLCSPVNYKRHRFRPAIIAHAVWLYFRFPLSFRLVEAMRLERGIAVSYKTIRRWSCKSRPQYVRRWRRKSACRYDIWNLGEVEISISGKKHWLWRAVDQDGYVLDGIVQSRRDAKAKREIVPDVEHRCHKGLNSRAGNSHVPLRKRERTMQGFRSIGSIQRFVSLFSAFRNLFVLLRPKRTAFQTFTHCLNAMAHRKIVSY